MTSKKSFRASDSFFSDIEEETTEKRDGASLEPMTARGTDIPEGYVLVPEGRSKRLQLLITPSLQERLKEIAKAENVSINEIANRALSDYTKAYREGR